MKGKKFCAFLSMVVVFSLLLSLCSFSVCSAAEGTTLQATEDQQAAFDSLPDNAIVCYLHGRPIYKYQITEDRRIVTQSNARISGGIVATLPLSHRGEIITANIWLSTIGFTQTEAVSYLPYDDALTFIELLEEDVPIVELISNVLGALELSGDAEVAAMMVDLLIGIGDLQTATVVAQIREVTDTHSDAIVTFVNTAYGGFYSVEEWDGITCVKEAEELSFGSMTVDVYCNHGSPWD